jgi:hypothetical protein
MVGVSRIKPAGGEMGKPLDFTAHGPLGETSPVPVSSPSPFPRLLVNHDKLLRANLILHLGHVSPLSVMEP